MIKCLLDEYSNTVILITRVQNLVFLNSPLHSDIKAQGARIVRARHLLLRNRHHLVVRIIYYGALAERPCGVLVRSILECSLPCKSRLATQLFFNADKLIEFRNALAPATRAGLEMARPCCNREVGDCCVFSFARTVRDEAVVIVLLRQFNRVECLAHSSNLVELNENGVGYAFVDPLLEDLRICAEDVIPDKLYL